MKNVDDIVKKNKHGLLQMENSLKPKKFKDFLNAPVNLEKLSKQGKDKGLAKETITNFDKLNEDVSDYFITGIHLNGQETGAPDGELAGWDADWGEMYALDGVLIPKSNYIEETGQDPAGQNASDEKVPPMNQEPVEKDVIADNGEVQSQDNDAQSQYNDNTQ